MILLESRSRIIEEHLFLCSSSSAHGDDDSNNNNDGGINTQTIPPSSPKNSFSKGFEVTFIDFGDCKYRLHNNGRSNVICLSMAFPSFNELKAKGLLEHLISIYKEYSVKVEEVVQSPSSPFYQLMFSLSKESLSTAAIRELSLIRRNCLAFPLLLAMNSGEKAGLIRVALRDSGNDDASSSTATATDAMYVKGCKDRVVVVLQTKFDDPSDHVLSRTFLQEFFDVRRQNSNLSNTPQILSSKEAPEDIKAVLVCDNSNNSSNNNNNNESHYITFILFPSHYEVGEKREKCLNTIINFRDYFHYHLKCCKSFLHTRMRGADPFRRFQMLFCPKCCNLLLLKKGTAGAGASATIKGGLIMFDCQYCNYSHEYTNTVLFDRKKVDDVFGGADSWKNVDSIEVTCPKCEHDRAYYMQIQIRSADEPSTIFYKCCNGKCSNQWREG